MNILLREVNIVSPGDSLNETADILIVNGIIQKIGRVNKLPKIAKELKCKGLTCTPGLFDMHVHFREPGQVHKENLQSGSEAAANGGFTGVLCMPNTIPPLDSPALLQNLVSKCKDFLVDVKFAACATSERKGEMLSPILSLSEAGAIAFTDDGSPVYNPEIMRRVLEFTSQIDSVVIQHCEDMRLSNGGVMNEGFISTSLGLRGIPAISETSVLARDILLTEYVRNSRYHIQHVSSAKSVDLVRDAKSKGTNVTAEVCPHHFILTEKECIGYNTYAKMNPPLRTSLDVSGILEGLRDDTIDVICTDHAPHSVYEKSQGFYDAPFGIIGLETAVGLAYTYLVKKNIITFEKLIEKMAVNPRKILRIDPVSISEGEPANLTLLNTKKRWKADVRKFKTKSLNTPFAGYELYCKPYCVINKSKIYFSEL